MIITCRACDERRHTGTANGCTGIAVYMEQDGPQRLVCDCHCRYSIRLAQRKREAVSDVLVLMRRHGLTVDDLTAEATP